MKPSTTSRQLFEVGLRPISGERFQPAGFPDIGNASFQRPTRDQEGRLTWKEALLVESSQSMANFLEATAWSEADDRPVDTFAGLPYVRVTSADGRYMTSSRTEAHRLASAFVKDSSLDGLGMRDVIRQRLGLEDDRPVPARNVSGAVLALDPLCLVHGVFFAEPAKVWPGQPKIARALTAFVEALDVRQAHSGGVKRDQVRHGLSDEAGGTAEGYGTVPFHRLEWTAESITAYFCLDRAQIAAYGLGPEASALLEAIARWEVRSLLEGGFRPRTACDLVPLSDVIVDQAGQALPSLDDLGAEVRRLVPACRDLLGDGTPLEVVWSGGTSRAKKRA